VERLEAEMQRPGFWDDQEAAARTSAAHARAQRKLKTFRDLESEAADLPPVQQERSDHLHQLRLGEPVEQKEQQQDPNAVLAKVRAKGF